MQQNNINGGMCEDSLSSLEETFRTCHNLHGPREISTPTGSVASEDKRSWSPSTISTIYGDSMDEESDEYSYVQNFWETLESTRTWSHRQSSQSNLLHAETTGLPLLLPRDGYLEPSGERATHTQILQNHQEIGTHASPLQIHPLTPHPENAAGHCSKTPQAQISSPAQISRCLDISLAINPSTVPCQDVSLDLTTKPKMANPVTDNLQPHQLCLVDKSEEVATSAVLQSYEEDFSEPTVIFGTMEPASINQWQPEWLRQMIEEPIGDSKDTNTSCYVPLLSESVIKPQCDSFGIHSNMPSMHLDHNSSRFLGMAQVQNGQSYSGETSKMIKFDNTITHPYLLMNTNNNKCETITSEHVSTANSDEMCPSVNHSHLELELQRNKISGIGTKFHNNKYIPLETVINEETNPIEETKENISLKFKNASKETIPALQVEYLMKKPKVIPSDTKHMMCNKTENNLMKKNVKNAAETSKLTEKVVNTLSNVAVENEVETVSTQHQEKNGKKKRKHGGKESPGKNEKYKLKIQDVNIKASVAVENESHTNTDKKDISICFLCPSKAPAPPQRLFKEYPGVVDIKVGDIVNGEEVTYCFIGHQYSPPPSPPKGRKPKIWTFP